MKSLLILLAVGLAGCAQINKGTDEIARYLDGYCATMDPAARIATRDTINSKTQLAEIKVTCPGDIDE